QNAKGVPGAGRDVDKADGQRRGPRAATLEYRRGAFVRNREPVLAYAVGNAFCRRSASALRKPLVGCWARHSGVAEHADEDRQRCSLAQSRQVAAVSRRKLGGS